MFVGLLFSFGVGTGYIFDDRTSVAPLEVLRAYPELFWSLVLDDTSGPLGRPVSIFSFAVEQYLPYAGPDFSQMINIAIHAVNTILVLLILLELCRRRGLNGNLACLVVVLLWSLAPQKVSSVLYIVQRMTLLSSLFIFIGMYAYLRLRDASGLRIWAWGLVLLASIVLAPYSKENGVLLIPLIAVLEVFHLRLTGPANRRDLIAYRGALFLLCAGAFLFAVFFVYWVTVRSASYADRGFTLTERIYLTPIVLLDYAKQFYLPDIRTMGVLYDDYCIRGSCRSYFVDATAYATLATAIGWLMFCFCTKRYSLAALGTALFLIGHSIESTFLPLEMYFEHRNYLPSVGLAVPLLGIAARVPQAWRRTSRYLFVSYIGVVAIATVSLAKAWSTHPSLVGHHLAGHPNSSRAHAEHSVYQALNQDTALANASIQRAFELAKMQPGAKKMMPLDPVLMRISAACFSNQKPTLPVLNKRIVRELQHFRTATVQIFRMNVGGALCPGFDWRSVSDWLLEFSSKAAQMGIKLPIQNLRDLAYFEMELNNPVRTFMYSAMLLEQDASDFDGQYLRLLASEQLGEVEQISESVRHLSQMSVRGSLTEKQRWLLATSLEGSPLCASGAASLCFEM